jgi:photosystem II stability/assembly factor-like uncharacterized protein
MHPLLLLLSSLLFAVPDQNQWWQVETSGIDTNLRGVSAAYGSDRKGKPVPVVWASGSNGVILKSLDGGKTWQRLHVVGGDALDFRGILAFNEKTVYVMSSGEGEKSRIYKTTDGGEVWTLQYTDKRREFFLDSIACVSETHCFALGDPIGGKFVLLTTTDGEHWNAVPVGGLPGALPGEGAFAASNTCLMVSGEEIVFGTGGPAARVFRTTDSGRTWTVAETPIDHGKASSGIFSITRRDGKEIVVVGGDYQDPQRASRVAAYSRDEGRTWQLSEPQPGGFRSSVACFAQAFCVAIGPTGGDIGFSKGSSVTWTPTDSLNLNAITILDGENGWAVGPKGTIARFKNQQIVAHRPLADPAASPIAH